MVKMLRAGFMPVGDSLVFWRIVPPEERRGDYMYHILSCPDKKGNWDMYLDEPFRRFDFHLDTFDFVANAVKTWYNTYTVEEVFTTTLLKEIWMQKMHNGEVVESNNYRYIANELESKRKSNVKRVL